MGGFKLERNKIKKRQKKRNYDDDGDDDDEEEEEEEGTDASSHPLKASV
jgi:hypothetical protein